MSVLSRIARLEARVERWPGRFVAFTVVLFVGCFGPWLCTHFSHLWEREHYQFFPMMLLAVVALSYGNWKNAQLQRLSFKKLKLSTPLLVMAALTFSAALWLNSPWLAFLSTITVLWAVLRNVPFGCSSIAPLFVLLPLPFSLDGDVVHGLQRLSSRGASALLDLASIRHLMSGNVLEVSDKKFFVEEACSGIGSIYLLLASAAIYASWRQLRAVVWVPLLISGVFWAAAGNTFRIFCVAWAHEKLRLDLSAGTTHDILGSATYLVSLLLLAMTEQALLFLFEPVSVTLRNDSTLDAKHRFATRIGTFWNRRTLMDSEIRIARMMEKGISGFRVTRGLFIVILMIFFSVGCAGNLWKFWPEIVGYSRFASLKSVPTSDGTTEFAEAVPLSVTATLSGLEPRILNQISGLAVVSREPAEMINNKTQQTTHLLKSPDLSSPINSKDDSVALLRVQWNLHRSEIAAILMIEGPFREIDRALVAPVPDEEHSDDGEWTVRESIAAPLAEIMGGVSAVREQALQDRQLIFGHDLTIDFTQTGTPMPTLEGATLSEIRHQLANAVDSLNDSREQWFCRVALRLESDRPAEHAIRHSRRSVYGDVREAILAHWRTPA